MPNWVFNNISGYTEEMHNKYKNEEEELDIDFNKVIPMPEELNFPDIRPTHENAIAAYEYEQYKNNAKKPFYYHAPSSIRNSMENYYNRNIADFGKMAVSNPDKSLNDIIDNEYDKKKLEDLKNIYGDLNTSNDKVGIDRLNRYTDYIENNYHKLYDNDKEILSNSTKSMIETYPTLIELGKHYVDCKEKYGFDNWYDWRVANWGTKWNASDTNYDGETIHFDTAWSVPHPIIAKIAEEFPETKLYGRSDEESGWFEEYYTKDGKLGVVGGEIEYDEDTDTSEDVYDDGITEPSTYETYEEISQRSIKEWASFVNHKKLIF